MTAIDTVVVAQVSSSNTGESAYVVTANSIDRIKVSTAEQPESAIFANQPAAVMVAVVDSVSGPTPIPPSPISESGLASFNPTASLNFVVPFAVLQATGAGGNVALPPEGTLQFSNPTPSVNFAVSPVEISLSVP
jgi:hypothetical protein